MVRPSLSILDPASAIFLAALMTSDVFFSGPFPLGRRETKDQLILLSCCSLSENTGATFSVMEQLFLLEGCGLSFFLQSDEPMNSEGRFVGKCLQLQQTKILFRLRFEY